MKGWLIVGHEILDQEHLHVSPASALDELCRQGWNGLLLPYLSSTGYSSHVCFSQLMTLSEQEIMQLSVEDQSALIKKRLGISSTDIQVLTTSEAIADQARLWNIPVSIISNDRCFEEELDSSFRNDVNLCILFAFDLSRILQAIRFITEHTEETSSFYFSLILSFKATLPPRNIREDLYNKNPSIFQSFQYREGHPVQVDLDQTPMIVTSITYDSSLSLIRHRKDLCTKMTFSEIVEKGGMSRLALAQFLPEMAFRLGKIPKYGA